MEGFIRLRALHGNGRCCSEKAETGSRMAPWAVGKEVQFMSYDLCLTKQAETPYYIENIQTGIYSLEELCFYFYNNICLIDETIINEKLCDWIRDELGLTRLYRQLYGQLEKEESAAFFVLSIFREAGYLTQQEMHEFQDRLMKLEVQSEDMKQKLRADYLVREKLFAKAIGEYRLILARRNPGKLGNQFYAAVWNNLGAAYAGLFQFKQAADCFLEAYGLLQSKENFRKYISALPLYLTEEEYQKKLAELGVDGYLAQKIQEYNAGVCTQPEFCRYMEQVCSQEPETLLAELKEQYCRSAKL